MLLPCFVCLYTAAVEIIQYGANITSWITMGWQIRHSVGFKFSTTQVPGCPIGLVSQSKYLSMWNWSNNWWWRRDEQSIFRIFFCVGIWYHSFRVQLVSDMHRQKKWSLNIYIYCFMLFYKIRLGGTSWYTKPTPVIFLFIAARDSLSNMCNFD